MKTKQLSNIRTPSNMHIYKAVCLLTSLLFFCCGQLAFAHSSSTSYLSVDASHDSLRGNWTVALQDLPAAIPLDSNNDLTLSWGELRRNFPVIIEYVNKNITFAKTLNNEKSKAVNTCLLNWNEPTLRKSHNDIYLSIDFTSACFITTHDLQLTTTALFDIDDTHRIISTINHIAADKQSTWVFTKEQNQLLISNHTASTTKAISSFFIQGVIHILEGYDHLIFIITMMIPFIIRRKSDVSMKEFSLNLIKIASAFTIGHSATLALATNGIWFPPASWVETFIAASIAIAGLNIIFPIFKQKEFYIAIAFGLIHGFGFANVLQPLLSNSSSMIISLASFNIGVEAGQLLVLCIAIPITLFICRYPLGIKTTKYATSLSAIAIGLFWMWERNPFAAI